MVVEFGTQYQLFWSCGFVYKTKKVNECGHISMVYSVERKEQTLICGTAIDENRKHFEQEERNVTMCVVLLDLTNKAM